MQTFLKKYPFKRSGKLLKFLHDSAGYKQAFWVLYPSKTIFCGVSDPFE
jgi:hypothetical protein